MEVGVFLSTTSVTFIKCLDNHFAGFGVPDGLRTDNGPNIVSKEMENYLGEMSLVQRHIQTLWPRANGEDAREKRSLLKATQVSQAEGKHWQAELNTVLLAYQSTNHSTTRVTPAEMFFKRKLTTKFHELKEAGKEQQWKVVFQQVRDRDSEKKQLAKDYANRRNHAKERSVGIGDAVLLEKRKEDKLSASYETSLI